MNEYERTEGVRSDADAGAAEGSDDPEARVEQLTAEIDDTRDELSETISEIGEKLTPANVARETGEAVKAATLGKVEQMTYGAQETWRDVRSGNTGSIVDTITSNPIPAGMVALGIGMLLMNRGQDAQRSGSRSRGDHGSYRGRDGDGYGHGMASWEQQDRSRRGGDSGSPMDRVGDAASQAGERVSQAADDLGRRAEQLPQQAGHAFEQGGNQVRRFIDENPLGAGVIALAAGAAIGMLLPTTPFERETLGPVRDDVVQKAEGAAHEAIDKAEQQADRAQASG